MGNLQLSPTKVAAGRKCKTIISRCVGIKFLEICVKIDVCY